MTATLAPVPSYAHAASLDEFLGNPDDDSSRVNHRDSLARDRQADFPHEAMSALADWDLARHYVPRAWGGELTDLMGLLLLVRQVGRRDVTAAVAHGKTFLGSVCAWAAADDSAERMARIVAHGDAVSWGLTEQGRGSDISSTATTARINGDFVVDGHKWPVGNATRGRAITVLARTDERPGPRAMSLVLVDKEQADTTTISYRPRRSLHGIRGADISGIDFARTRVPALSRVGDEGRGLELVLKSLQLTRTLCAALSLGAGDQALELALRPGQRPSGVHGTAVSTRDAATAAADHLLAEAVAFVAVREFHCSPAEMGLVSAFAKVLVPDSVGRVCRDLGSALGAAAQVASGGGVARFQKVVRDGRVVAIFDGNSVVNLNVVINEFVNIARPADVDVAAILSDFHCGRDGLEFDMGGLRLVTRRGSRVLRALPALAAALDDGRTDPAVVAVAASMVDEWHRAMAQVASAERFARPPVEQFVLAERLTLLFGAAASVALYLANRESAPGGVWADDLWIRGVLVRLAQLLGVEGTADIPLELGEYARAVTAAGAPVSLLAGWWHGGDRP